MIIQVVEMIQDKKEAPKSLSRFAFRRTVIALFSAPEPVQHPRELEYPPPGVEYARAVLQ